MELLQESSVGFTEAKTLYEERSLMLSPHKDGAPLEKKKKKLNLDFVLLSWCFLSSFWSKTACRVAVHEVTDLCFTH